MQERDEALAMGVNEIPQLRTWHADCDTGVIERDLHGPWLVQ